MPQQKGVRRRARVRDREDLAVTRWRIPVDIKDATARAAKESGLTESLYIDLLLRGIERENGTLPLFIDEQEHPTTNVA